MLPKGFLRWKLSSPDAGELLEGLYSQKSMNFALDAQQAAPPGMVAVPGENWVGIIAFIGSVGPFQIPSFYLDRMEVTNRDYQKFVDSGGYTKQQYWHEKFVRDGHEYSLDRSGSRCFAIQPTGQVRPAGLQATTRKDRQIFPSPA